ncbi:MAG: hypothetical protein R3E66_05320 [bacterium]
MRPSELITTILWIPLIIGAIVAIHWFGLSWVLSAILGVPAGLVLTLALKFATSFLDP